MAKYKSQADHDRVNLIDQLPLETPFVVYVEPCGYCNLKCAFCPQTQDMKRSIMNISTWKKLIDDISMFDIKLKLLRVCGNGEPLMNKDIEGMLEYAHIMDIAEKIELVTNGTLLTHGLCALLPKYCTRIIVSVNDEPLTEKVRELYRNSSDCTIAVKTVDQEKSVVYNNICDEVFVEKIVHLWPELEVGDREQFRWEDRKASPIKVCPQIFKGLQVQADGEVVACCVDWQRKRIIGNIKDDTLHSVWNGHSLKMLRQQHIAGHKEQLQPCRDCTMNDSCEYDNLDELCEAN